MEKVRDAATSLAASLLPGCAEQLLPLLLPALASRALPPHPPPPPPPSSSAAASAAPPAVSGEPTEEVRLRQVALLRACSDARALDGATPGASAAAPPLAAVAAAALRHPWAELPRAGAGLVRSALSRHSTSCGTTSQPPPAAAAAGSEQHATLAVALRPHLPALAAAAAAAAQHRHAAVRVAALSALLDIGVSSVEACGGGGGGDTAMDGYSDGSADAREEAARALLLSCLAPAARASGADASHAVRAAGADAAAAWLVAVARVSPPPLPQQSQFLLPPPDAPAGLWPSACASLLPVLLLACTDDGGGSEGARAAGGRLAAVAAAASSSCLTPPPPAPADGDAMATEGDDEDAEAPWWLRSLPAEVSPAVSHLPPCALESIAFLVSPLLHHLLARPPPSLARPAEPASSPSAAAAAAAAAAALRPSHPPSAAHHHALLSPASAAPPPSAVLPSLAGWSPSSRSDAARTLLAALSFAAPAAISSGLSSQPSPLLRAIAAGLAACRHEPRAASALVAAASLVGARVPPPSWAPLAAEPLLSPRHSGSGGDSGGGGGGGAAPPSPGLTADALLLLSSLLAGAAALRPPFFPPGRAASVSSSYAIDAGVVSIVVECLSCVATTSAAADQRHAGARAQAAAATARLVDACARGGGGGGDSGGGGGGGGDAARALLAPHAPRLFRLLLQLLSPAAAPAAPPATSASGDAADVAALSALSQLDAVFERRLFTAFAGGLLRSLLVDGEAPSWRGAVASTALSSSASAAASSSSAAQPSPAASLLPLLHTASFSPGFVAFAQLLRFAPSCESLSPHASDIASIAAAACQPNRDAPLVVATLNSIDSLIERFPTGESPFGRGGGASLRLMTSAFAPPMQWRSGGGAAACRHAAVVALGTLLRRHAASRTDALAALADPSACLLPRLVSASDDDHSSDCRSAAVHAAHALVLVLTCSAVPCDDASPPGGAHEFPPASAASIPSPVRSVLASALLARLNDARDAIRITAAAALAPLLRAPGTRGSTDTNESGEGEPAAVATGALPSLMVHMDDPNAAVRAAAGAAAAAAAEAGFFSAGGGGGGGGEWRRGAMAAAVAAAAGEARAVARHPDAFDELLARLA